LTDAKHSAIQNNHLADIDKTKHNYNQQNNHARKLLAYAHPKANETKAWFMGISQHPISK